jgi:ABC-type branched-subunit amino acid transport system ATPase component/ABC-type branched-subunit amino acid transport system permease subunit
VLSDLRRWLPVAAAVGAVAVVIPTSEVRLAVLFGVLVTAIAALGLDMLVARTGELSLAHAAFLGVGAFTAINVGGRGATWGVAVIAAVVVTAAAATVVGLPSLRIRGLQVAIATLAFQDAAEKYLFTNEDVTAGDKVLARPTALRTDTRLYLLALVALGVVLLVRRRVTSTRAGRSFVAVRDIGERSRAFGIEPGPTKLFAYALSGAIVGLAGALLATHEGTIGTATDPFKLLESLQLVAIAVVGGAGSATGIIIAAFLVKGLPQLTGGDFLRDWTPIVSAGLLVIAVVVQPRGIGGVLGGLLDRVLPTRARPSPSVEGVDLAHVARPIALRLPVPALLRAHEVSVIYGGLRALDRLTLEVRRGEIVGLIGANGAGKSTFFNAVSGFAPVTGSIRYRDVDLLRTRPAGRTALGAARTFQDMGLVRAETVAENLLLAQTWLADYPSALGILGLGSTIRRERDLRRRAHAALEVFGLRELAAERLGDLPYGTMRRVEIASAVAAGPDLLLLDEATAGLGPEESHALAGTFLDLREELGLTLVVIEHHVPVIARVCDYVYCLEAGALIAEGAPEDVTADPAVIASFLGTHR